MLPGNQAAKCLKYAGYTTLCDVMFGFFMVSWVVARHVLYLLVCRSIWVQAAAIMPSICYSGPNHNRTGPYYPPLNENGGLYLLEPLWRQDGQVCFDAKAKWSFLSLLLFLQVLLLVWFASIVRVAVRVIRGDGADDVRSDDEEEGEEEEEQVEIEYEEAEPFEEEVGVEDLDLKGWERRTGVKRAASAATGVSLPGHSDRKELLGRIGCEKQVD